MSRLFLFGTLRWQTLLDHVAGQAVACSPAVLDGWHVERAAAGDWPILVSGGQVTGLLTEPLGDEVRARLDWYERVFGHVAEAVDIAGTPALVYREADGDGGSGEAWSLEDWIAVHGARTLLAADEVLRARGVVTEGEIAARRAVVQARAHGIDAARKRRRPATIGGDLTSDDIAVHRTVYPYEGFHRVEEWHLDHACFDGSRSPRLQRAISHVTDAATVLPYDPVRDRVMVVEQVRIGALAKGDPQPWLIEPVAGLIDAGETPETTALRELEEEAGLHAAPDALRFVSRYYPSPGGLAQVLHSFVALCDLPDGAAGLGGLDTEAEDIRAHLVSLDALIDMIATGEAANAPLVISAQWLALNKGRLCG